MRRMRFVHTPEHSNRLNQVETLFSTTNRRPLKTGSHEPVEELEESVRHCVSQHNIIGEPCEWTGAQAAFTA